MKGYRDWNRQQHLQKNDNSYKKMTIPHGLTYADFKMRIHIPINKYAVICGNMW